MTYDEFFQQVSYNEFHTIKLTFGSILHGIILKHHMWKFYFNLDMPDGTWHVIPYSDVKETA